MTKREIAQKVRATLTASGRSFARSVTGWPVGAEGQRNGSLQPGYRISTDDEAVVVRYVTEQDHRMTEIAGAEMRRDRAKLLATVARLIEDSGDLRADLVAPLNQAPFLQVYSREHDR